MRRVKAVCKYCGCEFEYDKKNEWYNPRQYCDEHRSRKYWSRVSDRKRRMRKAIQYWAENPVVTSDAR